MPIHRTQSHPCPLYPEIFIVRIAESRFPGSLHSSDGAVRIFVNTEKIQLCIYILVFMHVNVGNIRIPLKMWNLIPLTTLVSN